MRTPSDELIAAIIENKLVPAKILITPNYQTRIPRIDILSFTDNSGITALHGAAKYNRPELIQLFLTVVSTHYPAQLNQFLNRQAGQYNNTPLLESVLSHATESVQILLQNNVDINLTDSFGHGPIYYALRYGMLPIFSLLNNQFERLYDPATVKNHYKNLIKLFVKEDNIEVFRILISHPNVFFEDDIFNEAKGKIKSLLEYKPAKRLANIGRFPSIKSYYADEKKPSAAFLKILEDQKNSSDEESSDSEIDDFYILKSRNQVKEKSNPTQLLARGVHFSPEYYTTSARRSLRKPEPHNQPVGSRATTKLAESKGFERADQLIKGYFELLKMTPDKPELDQLYKKKVRTKGNQTATFDTLYHHFVQAYVNSYGELFNQGGVVRNFNFFCSVNPFLSTTPDCTIAAKYANGQRINHTLKMKPKLRKSTGVLKHRHIGYVEVYELDQDFYQKYSLDVNFLNNQRKIGITHNYSFNKEILIESSIPKEYVLGFQMISLPSFNRPWSEAIFKNYGLDEINYNKYRQALLSDQAATEIDKLIEVVSAYQANRMVTQLNLPNSLPIQTSYFPLLSFSQLPPLPPTPPIGLPEPKLEHPADSILAAQLQKGEIEKRFQLFRKNEYDGFTYDSKQPLLEGKLPDGKPIQLEMFEAKGDGNCAYYALGIEREAVVKILEPLADDEKIRKSLAREIMNEFKSNSLGQAETLESKNLYQKYLDLQQRQVFLENQANAEIKKLTPAAERMGLDSLIKSILLPISIRNQLEQFKKESAEIENSIQRCCESKEMFLSYVRNSLGRQGWLGYQSALLVAQQKHFNLYIWRKLGQNSLECTHYHQEDKAVNTFHILHTNRFTHFNLLAQASNPLTRHSSSQPYSFFSSTAAMALPNSHLPMTFTVSDAPSTHRTTSSYSPRFVTTPQESKETENIARLFKSALSLIDELYPPHDKSGKRRHYLKMVTDLKKEYQKSFKKEDIELLVSNLQSLKIVALAARPLQLLVLK